MTLSCSYGSVFFPENIGAGFHLKKKQFHSFEPFYTRIWYNSFSIISGFYFFFLFFKFINFAITITLPVKFYHI